MARFYEVQEQQLILRGDIGQAITMDDLREFVQRTADQPGYTFLQAHVINGEWETLNQIRVVEAEMKEV